MASSYFELTLQVFLNSTRSMMEIYKKLEDKKKKAFISGENFKRVCTKSENKLSYASSRQVTKKPLKL